MAKILTQEEIEKKHGDDSNVLNKDEVQKAEGVTLPPDKKKRKKKENVKVKFECPFTPMGKSNTVITLKLSADKKLVYDIQMENKIYMFPENLSEEEEQNLRKALIANGFKDITRNESGIKYDKKKEKYIYTVHHPEHTPENPMSGNISLIMTDEKGRPAYDEDGKQIIKQVSFVNGKVETDDEKIYNALIKAGFFSGHKKVREE